MSTFTAALAVEARKARSARVLWSTGILLVEQHVGFALAAASRYYVMEAGRITSTGAGGADAHADVRAAMAI